MKTYRTVVEITYATTPARAVKIHAAIEEAIDSVFEGPLSEIVAAWFNQWPQQFIGSTVSRYEILDMSTT